MSELSISGFIVLVLLLGILAQWIAWRIKLPSILLLLLLGLGLGYWTNPDDIFARMIGTEFDFARQILFPIVSLSVAIILFEGGLTLRWGQLAGNGRVVFRLITVASIITWVLTALLARYVLQLGWPVSWLLGAILMVTGPTVVGPLLRQIRPNRRVTSILQWEGILIDPVGAIAAVLVFDVLTHTDASTPLAIAVMVLQTLVVGLIAGAVVALLLSVMLKNFWLPDYLHGVFFLVSALIAFVVSNHLSDESGLVAVTVLGIALANQKWVSIEHVLEFKENLRVLLIGTLFILLGSRLKISDLAEVGWAGIPFLLGLIFLVRPISIFVATIGCRLPWKERLFLGAVAPRGIVAASVASVFGLKLATFEQSLPADAPGVSEARLLGTVTFLVILGTVSFCGLGAGPLARRLGLSDPDPQGILFIGASAWVRELASVLTTHQVTVMLLDRNFNNFSAARMAGLNAHCVNALSEHAQESLELAGMGRVFAVTPNDEVNTLAMHEYMRFFPRSALYQLATQGKSSARWQTLSETRRGRTLFDGEVTHLVLADKHAKGATIKATALTESFTLNDYITQHGADTDILMAITADGRLKIKTPQTPFTGAPGDRIIAMVPPKNSRADMTPTDPTG